MKKEKFPNKIPIFPLSSAIFFPKTILPLNIFEDRYIQLVNDCMRENRIFGMVQPKNQKVTFTWRSNTTVILISHRSGVDRVPGTI